MSSVSPQWEVYIDVVAPAGCHFHTSEVDNISEQLSVTGSWWTGKYQCLSCLLKNRTYELSMEAAKLRRKMQKEIRAKALRRAKTTNCKNGGKSPQSGSKGQITARQPQCLTADLNYVPYKVDVVMTQEAKRIDKLIRSMYDILKDMPDYKNGIAFSSEKVSPYQFVDLIGLTLYFHTSLKDASWDDFQEVFGYHDVMI